MVQQCKVPNQNTMVSDTTLRYHGTLSWYFWPQNHLIDYDRSQAMRNACAVTQDIIVTHFDDGACVCMYSRVFCTTPCSAMRSFSFRPFAFFSMPCAITQKQSRWTCSSCVCSKSYLQRHHHSITIGIIISLTLWRPLLPYGYSILCQTGLNRHL